MAAGSVDRTRIGRCAGLDQNLLMDDPIGRQNRGMRVNQEHVTHPDAAFRMLELRLRAFDGPRHRHAQVELTWVRRGQGVRFVGDSAEPFHDGDLVLLGADLPHRWSGRAGAGTPPFEAQVLQFPPELLASPLWPELQALAPLADLARRGLVVEGPAHVEVTGLLAAMPASPPLRRLALWVQVMHALQQALLRGGELRVLASVAPAARHDEAAAPRRIDRVIDWLHRQLHTPLPLAEAARVAHVSPAAFSRFFHRETGKTWTAYVNDVRCSEAAARLRQGNRPVAEVMSACGYRSASHFNRAFLQRFGLAPRAYRQSLR
jgi:AraC-like DNA-binding protein